MVTVNENSGPIKSLESGEGVGIDRLMNYFRLPKNDRSLESVQFFSYRIMTKRTKLTNTRNVLICKKMN